MQTVAALSAAALLSITTPFQQGLEAYKEGKFPEAAAALDRAVQQAGTNQVELAESARIWIAAARVRVRGDEKARTQGIKELKAAYAAAYDPARRTLAFELWKEAALDPADLEPAKSPENTVQTMQRLVAAGQIGQAESMLGPPLSTVLAMWQRVSDDHDSPLEMLEDIPALNLSAGEVQWPEGRVVITANIEIVDVDLELLIRPDGWVISRILGTRSPAMAMGMANIQMGPVQMPEPEEDADSDEEITRTADAGEAKPAVKAMGEEKGASGAALEEIQKWIHELSSPDATTRSRARESLQKAGPAAYPALREALKHADPEVSETARGLLP